MTNLPSAHIAPACLKNAPIVTLPKGARIFQVGDPCSHFFYLLSGSVRVDFIAKNGKTIMLYRFGAAQTCVLTTSCLLSGEDYCAEANAETDITACALPLSDFDAQLNASSEFRRLVLTSFAQRIAAMMSKLEEVAFAPIDARLASRALEMQSQDCHVLATHEQLAADLGTAREVVSRKLAEWENLGLIKRARGSFHILNVLALRHMAQHSD